MKPKKDPAAAETARATDIPAVVHERLVRHSLTLDEFIFEQLKSLEDFESSWRELHRKNDDIYPLEMFAGDWSEQLAVWRERGDLILPNK